MRRIREMVGLLMVATALLATGASSAWAAAQCQQPIPWQDCDGNGIHDNCDLSCGAQYGMCLSCMAVAGCGEAADCNANNKPDACDPDCDGPAEAHLGRPKHAPLFFFVRTHETGFNVNLFRTMLYVRL